MKVAFFGTPEFAVPTLDMLLNTSGFEVVAIITQPDRPAGRDLKMQKSRVKVFAEEHMLTLSRLSKKFSLLTPEDPHDEDVRVHLENLEPDVAVVVAYGKILKPELIDFFPKGAFNVHASLLPKWRGAAPITWAIWSEETETGVTLQKIAPKLDSGDIIAQSKVKIDKDWDAPKLYQELSRRSAEVVRRYLPEFIEGKIKAQPQNEKDATYARKIVKQDGKIDWNQTAGQIHAQLRALSPWPGIWTTRNGSVIKILRASPIEYVGGEPSEVIAADKVAFYVQCGMGTALKVEVVQPESRSRMPSSSYLIGKPFFKGDKIGT